MGTEAEVLASNEWHFVTRFPPRYLDRPHDIELFRRWISEREDAFPGFSTRLHTAAMLAITSDDAAIVRQGLQCLATVGTAGDVKMLSAIQSDDPLVARDVRTCLFEIKMRSRGS